MPPSHPLKSATPPITRAHPPPTSHQTGPLTYTRANQRATTPRTPDLSARTDLRPPQPASVVCWPSCSCRLLYWDDARTAARAPCILPSLLGFTMTMMVGDVRCGGEWPLVRRCRNGLVTLQPLTRHLGNIRRPQVSLPGCLASTSRAYNLTFGGKVNCWAFLGVVDFWA